MNLKRSFLIFGGACVILFMVGRWTAPKPHSNELEKARIKQLEQETVTLKIALDLSEQQKEIHRENAEQYFKEAHESQKPKIIYLKAQNDQIKRIDSFDGRQLDSLYRSKYPTTYLYPN